MRVNDFSFKLARKGRNVGLLELATCHHYVVIFVILYF